MAKKTSPIAAIETLYSNIRHIIEQARDTAYRAVNFAMAQAYWHIGKLVVEEEQSGKQRAEYGNELIKQRSKKTHHRIWQRVYRNQPEIYAPVLQHL